MSEITCVYEKETLSVKLPSTFKEIEKQVKKGFKIEDGVKLEFNYASSKFYNDKTYLAFKSLDKIPKKVKISKIKETPYQNIFTAEITSALKSVQKEMSKLKDDKLNELREHYFDEIQRKELPKHEGIICHKCFQKDFLGSRFMCSECNNVNYCEDCAFVSNHPKEHLLIKINFPIKDSCDTLSSYFVNNKCEVNAKKKSFNVKILNDGETEWNGVCLLPIGNAAYYVRGQKKVLKNVQAGETVEESIMVNCQQNSGKCKTKWRLFNASGLPFGDVLELELNLC